MVLTQAILSWLYLVYKMYNVQQQCLACDLDLWPLTFKSNRCHPLVIKSNCTKFDGPGWNGSVCIMFTSKIKKVPRDTSFAERSTDWSATRECLHFNKIFSVLTVDSDNQSLSRLHLCSTLFLSFPGKRRKTPISSLLKKIHICYLN